MKIRRWVAIAADGELLAFGISAERRFSRYCLRHSCGSYRKWVAEGARYCELFVPFTGLGWAGNSAVPKPGIYIHNFPHGRIRKCKSAKPIF